MFDIGWTEMLVVAVVMILVVGPKDLPGMLRTIGKTVGNMRRMAGDFQRQFSDALKEADIDEVKKDLSQAASFSNPLEDINKSAEELMDSLKLEEDVDDKIGADVMGSKPVGTSVGRRAKAKTTKKASVKKAPAKRAVTKSKAAKPASATKTAQKKPAAKKPTARRKVTTGSKSA